VVGVVTWQASGRRVVPTNLGDLLNMSLPIFVYIHTKEEALRIRDTSIYNIRTKGKLNEL
jgi:hypothetical protein